MNMIWAVLIILNAISITFTFIGVKWMRIYYYDRYVIHQYLSQNFRGMPAAKTIRIAYVIGSFTISIISALLVVYL